MRTLWKDVAEEFWYAFTHTLAAIFGEPLPDTDSYKRYFFRGRSYTIKKD